MKTIWKFEITRAIKMPKNAKILSINSSDLWAEVDITEELVTRKFMYFETGEDMKYLPAHSIFIGTSHSSVGKVHHVYEILSLDVKKEIIKPKKISPKFL